VAAVALALLLTGAVVYVGLRDGAPQGDGQAAGPNPSSSPTPTPMASLDLSGLPIERTDFCNRLDEGDVEDALGSMFRGLGDEPGVDRAIEIGSGAHASALPTDPLRASASRAARRASVA